MAAMRYYGRPRTRGGVQAVGNLVGGGVGGAEIMSKIRQHTALLVWAEVVGPQVAGATEVLGVDNGILRVSTKSAVWSNELTFYKKDILSRLNIRIGSHRENPLITDILFQNRGVTRKPVTEEELPRPWVPTPEQLEDIELSAREREIIEEGISAITDEGLRDKLRRIRVSDARLRTWRLDSGWLPCPRCGDVVPPPLIAPEYNEPEYTEGDEEEAEPQDAEPLASCPRCRIERNRR